MGYVEHTTLDGIRIPCAQTSLKFEEQVEEEMNMIRFKLQNLWERTNNVAECLVTRKKGGCINRHHHRNHHPVQGSTS